MGDGDEFPSRIYVITSKCRDLLQFDVEISRVKDEENLFLSNFWESGDEFCKKLINVDTQWLWFLTTKNKLFRIVLLNDVTGHV